MHRVFSIMPYISINYRLNLSAPMGQWSCSRASSLGPYLTAPAPALRNSPAYCGQCVSFVTQVCPKIPVSTSKWVRGALVRGDKSIRSGTAIATFNPKGHYYGHAAIYVSQDKNGIHVVDQWVDGVPKPAHDRVIRWNGGPNVANNGDSFYVVE